MQRRKIFVLGLAAAFGIAMACARQSSSPTSPSVAGPGAANAAADGSTAKISAPVPQSPINGVQPQDIEVRLVATAATGTYTTPVGLQYRFELRNSAGATVQSALVSTPSFLVTIEFVADQPYTWRVRGELSGQPGPWSSVASFIGPNANGYIRGNEVYDPLTRGTTVGEIHGPVTFIPNVGVRMDSPGSYIQYALPQTLVEGEYSALISGLSVISPNEDPKWRMITMREGDSQINDNEYRMSVDKRGNGAVAFRFLTGPGDYVETIGRERMVRSFHEDLTYFVQATWRDHLFNVLIKEGGFNGEEIYDFGKEYERDYTPLPHRAFVGSPFDAGDRGDPSTVEDMIVRQVWISSRPRPAYANK